MSCELFDVGHTVLAMQNVHQILGTTGASEMERTRDSWTTM